MIKQERRDSDSFTRFIFSSYIHYRTAFYAHSCYKTSHDRIVAVFLVKCVCGYSLYCTSNYELKKRRATMDVLILLSTNIAYFYKCVCCIK